jgi:gluconolactonase
MTRAVFRCRCTTHEFDCPGCAKNDACFGDDDAVERGGHACSRDAARGEYGIITKADGMAKVVIGPGEFAMPNGVELSPDGKTLYVNNTWQKPVENFVWAYDVAEDGALSKKPQFAKLNLTPTVLNAPKPEDRVDSGADGSTVDTDGRYYVATRTGVQIFMPGGSYAGTIFVPQYPVSMAFGGANNDILYKGGESSVWSIQTKVHGFRLPEGMN